MAEDAEAQRREEERRLRREERQRKLKEEEEKWEAERKQREEERKLRRLQREGKSDSSQDGSRDNSSIKEKENESDQKKEDDDAAARKKQEEDAASRLRAEEATNQQQQEEERKQREEETKKKNEEASRAKEEELRKKKEEEEAARAKQQQEESKRRNEEDAKQREVEEQEKLRKKKEEEEKARERAIREEEEETRRKKQKEIEEAESKKKREEEEIEEAIAKKKREEEKEEANKKKEEAAAIRRKQEEEELAALKRKETEEAEANRVKQQKKLEEEAAAAAAREEEIRVNKKREQERREKEESERKVKKEQRLSKSLSSSTVNGALLDNKKNQVVGVIVPSLSPEEAAAKKAEVLKKYVGSNRPPVYVIHDKRIELTKTWNQLISKLDQLEGEKLREMAAKHSVAFLRVLAVLLEGTSSEYSAYGGMTLNEEHAEQGFRWIDPREQHISVRLAEEKDVQANKPLNGALQLKRFIKETTKVLQCVTLPSISEDEATSALGRNKLNQNPNYIWAACEIARQKISDSFRPLLRQITSRAAWLLKRQSEVVELVLLHKKLSPIGGRDFPFYRAFITGTFAEYVENTARQFSTKCEEEFMSTKTIYWEFSMENKKEFGERELVSLANIIFNTLKDRLVTKVVLLMCHFFIFSIIDKNQGWEEIGAKVHSLDQTQLEELFQVAIMKKELDDEEEKLRKEIESLEEQEKLLFGGKLISGPQLS